MTPTFDVDDADALCAREPITRLERIQSFGFLIAMSRNWTILRASANLETFLGIEATAALGQRIDAFANPLALHDIRNRLLTLMVTGGIERLYGISLIVGRPALDIAVHYAEEICVFEGEWAGQDSRIDAASVVRTMLARLSTQPTLEKFHWDAARQIRAVTGFNRVMIYRFESDDSGEVIAESTNAVPTAYLHLHFPSPDIPAQARALYLRNPFRIIANVAADTVPLLTASTSAREPLDLSLAITRAVSPIHIEYLRNMEVAAALSISIIVDGALWGLIACHNATPLLPSFAVRSAAELFGQMYSMTLENRIRREADHEDRLGLEAVERFVKVVADDPAQLTHAAWMHHAISSIIACDGIAVCRNGGVMVSGAVPDSVGIDTIAEALDEMSAARVYSTDNLAAALPGWQMLPHAAGMLAIAISRTERGYILLFRREYRYDVVWAGNPAKTASAAFNFSRLSPRTSFAAFTESRLGHARPFGHSEKRLAESLRVGLIEPLVRGSAEGDALNRRNTQRQELLIAELNHRVRNVFALIRGLISHTSGESEIANYVLSLNGRVQALARAHDRVTQQNWGPSSLHAIFDDEIRAYVPARRDRFVIQGAQVLLRPQAFSTFALIIHELVTNSVKYGALSGEGRVKVTLEHTPQGLLFKWREIDGPPVKPPTRRGFGSVIIERVVPFDLQGTASVRYLPDGLQADFNIPEVHIASNMALSEQASPSTPVIASTGLTDDDSQPLLDHSVLLLEDNFIVALETEDLLKILGSPRVRAVPSIAAAEQALLHERPDFAVLDINLGAETSLDFAARLGTLNIPFIFASGYSGEENHDKQPLTPLTISKPFDLKQLRGVVVDALLAHSDRALPSTAD